MTQIKIIKRDAIMMMANCHDKHNVTKSISSRQVSFGNNDTKKDQHNHKIKTKKRDKKGCSVTVVVGDSIVKKN